MSKVMNQQPDQRQEKAKRFKRAAQAKPIQLTDRDVEVLEALAIHRILSGDQLRRLVFQCSGSRVRRRLRALYDHGYVERVSVVAQPTKNIPPFVYQLTKRGIDALAEMEIATTERGVNGASPPFVRHKLLINDFFISLHEAVRNTQYRVLDWRHEQDLKIATPDGKGRAEVVRHPSLAQPTSFLPDGYFEIEFAPGRSYAYFVEIDLATHAQRVWRERSRLYTAYADPQLGLFRQRFGRESFRLAIITTPDYRQRSRCNNILSSIHQTVGASDLFLATPLDHVTGDQLLTRVWRTPGSERRQSLVDGAGPRPAIQVEQRQRVQPPAAVTEQNTNVVRVTGHVTPVLVRRG